MLGYKLGNKRGRKVMVRGRGKGRGRSLDSFCSNVEKIV